jgi:hypothetical protein
MLDVHAGVRTSKYDLSHLQFILPDNAGHLDLALGYLHAGAVTEPWHGHC